MAISHRSSNLRLLIATVLVGLAIVTGVGLLTRGGSGEPLAPYRDPSPLRAPASAVLDPAVPPEDAAEREHVEPPPLASEASAAARTAGVAGVVLDADTGEPLERFEIVHFPTGAGGTYVETPLGHELVLPWPAASFEGTDGRFDLAGLDPEGQSFLAVAEGYEPARAQIVELRPGVAGEELVFSLRRGATVRGRVVDPTTGAAVQGALVAWTDDGGRTRTPANEQFVRTDALGRFVLDGIPPGTRKLMASHGESSQAFSEPLELGRGPFEREVVIALPNPP